MVLVEIFSTARCSYCEKAKQLLKSQSIEFNELNVSDVEENRAELLKRLPSVRSMPQIFVNGRHVGGYEDLEILERDRGLKTAFDEI